MRAALALIAVALALPCRAQDASSRLLGLSGMRYSIERVGSFTYLHCQDTQRPDCALFERLAIQPDVDWDGLTTGAAKAAKRKRKRSGPLPVLAKAGVDDQHGGLWIIALLPAGVGRSADFLSGLTYVVAPQFPGYRVSFDDRSQVAGAEVFLDKKEWAKALAAQPKKKTGLAKLLE